MAEDALKHCVLALDLLEGPMLFPLSLPVDATIAAALLQARQQLHEPGLAVDWEGAATGLWGVRCERSIVPRDGDRIELYRPLAADPRQRRRQRARAARRPS